MQEIILKWSIRKGFFVVPGDDLCNAARENGHKPLPFHLKGDKLADPDRFNASAMERDWPRLLVDHHQHRLTSALIACDIKLETLSTFQRLELFRALADLTDGATPQETIERMERCR